MEEKRTFSEIKDLADKYNDRKQNPAKNRAENNRHQLMLDRRDK